MKTLSGIQFFENPLCETIKVRHEVRPHPNKKRRRNWSVVRIESREPAAYLTSIGLFAHPAIIAKLRKENSAYDIRNQP